MAERAEMFNAVSVATSQNLEISSLFDANHQQLGQAQKTLAELLEGCEDGYEKYAEIRASTKYAMDTVSAVRVRCCPAQLLQD